LLLLPPTGQNVTIPASWRIILDESPPPLALLLIEGWLRFDNTTDVNLTAGYVIVRGAAGILQIGAPDAPHPTLASINLTGTRQSRDFVVNSALNMGAKVLGAYNGGAIRIFGQPVGRRWACRVLCYVADCVAHLLYGRVPRMCLVHEARLLLGATMHMGILVAPAADSALDMSWCGQDSGVLPACAPPAHPVPPTSLRWTRLAENALAGSTTAVVGDGSVSWAPGQRLLLMSSAFNPWQVGGAAHG
jgi:hypothetical protein